MGYYFSFDGVDDRAVVAHNSGIVFTSSQSFTLELWVEIKTLKNAWTCIVAKSRDQGSWYGVWLDNTNKWVGNIGGAGNNLIGSTAATTGLHHVVITQDTTNNIRRMYVDKAQIASLAGTMNANGNGELWFGGAKNLNEYFNGNQFHTRIYGKALSASEVELNFNSGKSSNSGTVRDSIISEWFFDEGTGTTVLDQTGNGRHATLVGGTWIGEPEEEESEPFTARFATRQAIFVPRTETAPTLQQVYAKRSAREATRQTIFASRSYRAPTKQSIFARHLQRLATRQAIFVRYFFRVPTRQEIFVGLVKVLYRFATRQTITKQVSERAPTVHRIYIPRSTRFETLQRVFTKHSASAPTRQVIHRLERVRAATKQVVYALRTWRFATIQRIIDPDKSIIGRVKLVAGRVLRVSLLGSREIIVKLRGGIVTEKNQDIEMAAGNSKEIEVTCEKIDLSGATIRWAAVKTIYTPNPPKVITKDNSNNGIKLESDRVFVITLNREDTEGLSGEYYHEAEITDANGNVSTVMTGKLKVTPSIRH